MAWVVALQKAVTPERMLELKEWRELGKDEEWLLGWLDDIRDLLAADRVSATEAYAMLREVVHPKQEEMRW